MDAKQKVIEIIASVCETEPANIKPETTIGDYPGWDSMGQLTILQRIEEELGISFEPEEMMDLEDANDIIKAVENKV